MSFPRDSTGTRAGKSSSSFNYICRKPSQARLKGGWVATGAAPRPAKEPMRPEMQPQGTTRGTTIGSWLLARWKLLLFLVLVVYALGMAGLYVYVENNPDFCKSCHTMTKAWDKWRVSVHKEVSCHSCHRQSPIQGLEQVWKYVTERPKEVSKHAVVPNEVCAECHESNDPRWKQVADTAGHKVHAVKLQEKCTTCHSTSLHRFEPPEEICAKCHEDHVTGAKSMKIDKMALHCLDCHNYLAEGSPLRPNRETCLGCHKKLADSGQVKWNVTWPDKAPMKVECSDCHKPHIKKEPVVNCASCHGDEAKKGLHSRGAHPSVSCQACHKPHRWVVETRDACTQCHADRINHNEGTVCVSCHSFK